MMLIVKNIYENTVGDGVSGVTEEGCHPSVLVCLISGQGVLLLLGA